MNPNEPESRGGLPALLRAVGALAVLLLALIGILAVLDIVTAEELREWFTKTGLVIAIVLAAVVALFVLTRAGGSKS
jgi:membrane protein YdbS with pleckstrin-like domain